MKKGPLCARLLFCVAVLLTFAPAVSAQKDSKTTVQEKANATIIEVPVNVIGKDDRPLSGLTVADFELYDNGKKQLISGFEVVDLQSRPTDPVNPVPEAPPPVARRHWLLVFDLSYSSSTALLRAREGARSIVEKSMAPTDLAGVATLSVESGWKLLENFTNDRAQLVNAIDTLGLLRTGVRTGDPLGFAFMPLTQGSVRNAIMGMRGNTVTSLLEQLQNLERIQLKASDEEQRGRVSQQVGSLGKMAQLLDSVRGRKYVLLFSEGFESRLITGNAGRLATPLGETSPTQDTAAEAVIKGETWKVDSDTRFGSSATRSFLADAMSVFRRADVVLNTVDISGLRAEGEVTRRAGSGTDALFTMAKETNGELIRNTNQLSEALRQLIDRTALVYILAFRPASLSAPGTFHELRVKVRVPTSKISLRSGYHEPRPYRELTSMERMLASGDLLAAGGGREEIPVHMLSAPFSSDGTVAQVPVILEIEGKALIEGDTSRTSQIRIYSYAFDANGTLADYLTQEISLNLEQVGPQLEASGIKYYGTLFLRPGRYSLRALVRNVFTGRSTLAAAALTVPSIPGGEPTVLSPFFCDPTTPWMTVRTNPSAESSRVAVKYPFAIEGESFIPAAFPVVARNALVKVAVMTFNFGGADKPEPLQVLGEVVRPDGKARSIDVQSGRRSDIVSNGGQGFFLSFNPESLEPGPYVFKVRATDPVSRKSAEAATAFEVRAP